MSSDIIAMAREAGFAASWSEAAGEALERLVSLAQAAERNKVAAWMMAQGYATGHGETMEGLLKELEWQVRESEREACAEKTGEFARKWWSIHCDSNKHMETTLKAHQDFCALQAAIRSRKTT
jgi:cell division inhibitor SulA